MKNKYNYLEEAKSIKKMTYFDHLEVLRWKIIYVLICFLIMFGISIAFIDVIIDVLQEPIKDFNISLYYFKPYEKFATYVKIAFYSGIFLSLPFAVLQLMIFLYPALKTDEKKYFFLTTIPIPLIFGLGAFFSYRIISPLAFEFFLNFSSGDNVTAMWSFNEYYSMLLGMMIVSGIMFQLPLFLFLLVKIGIIKIEHLKKMRGYIVVIIFLISALFTPPDVISQIMISIPMYLLFELVILICSIGNKQK